MVERCIMGNGSFQKQEAMYAVWSTLMLTLRFLDWWTRRKAPRCEHVDVMGQRQVERAVMV